MQQPEAAKTRLEEIGAHFCACLIEDLKQSCKDFESKIFLAQQGFEFTENSAYFLAQFTDQLRFAVYAAMDVMEKSALLAAGKSVALGVVQAGVGHFLLGETKGGIAFQGVNAALTGGLALKQANDITKAQALAEKILTFLADPSKKMPGKMIERLAIRLWQNFRLHIELLKKGKKGSDILIEYFVTQIICAIQAAPLHMVGEDKEATLSYIYQQIMLGKEGFFSKSVPATPLKTRRDKSHLEWSLRELIQHSPRVKCESFSMPGSTRPLFRFEMYHCELTKTRGFKEVSADDSHKYPSVLIFSQAELDRLPNFKGGKRYIVQIPNESERNRNRCEINVELYCRLYEKARLVKQRRESSNVTTDLIELMTFFCMISDSVIDSVQNLRQTSWLYSLVELINLVNMYEDYINHTLNSNSDLIEKVRADKHFAALFGHARGNAQKMEDLFKASEEAEKNRVEGVERKQQVLKMVELAPSVKLMDVEKRGFSIFQAPGKTEEWKALDFSKDDGVVARFEGCQIPIALRIVLSLESSFKDPDGREVKGPILSVQDCDNYNILLTQYFSHMQNGNYIGAFYAFMSAAYYFTFGINDPLVFIQKDMSLIEFIKERCQMLMDEYKSLIDEIFDKGGIEALEGYSAERGDGRAFKESTLLHASLQETIRLYQSCKEIRDDKTLREQFSELPTAGKVAMGVAGGVAIGAVIYFSYRAVKSQIDKTENKNNNTQNSSPATTTHNDNNVQTADTSVKTQGGLLSTASLVSGAMGMVIAGGIIVSNDILCKSMATKRVIGKMFEDNSPLIRMVKNPRIVVGPASVAQSSELEPSSTPPNSSNEEASASNNSNLTSSSCRIF